MPLTFSDSPLDTADHIRSDEAALRAAMDDSSSRFLPCWKLNAFLHKTDEKVSLGWLSAQQIGPQLLQEKVVFLGLLGDVHYFACDVDHIGPEDAPPFEEWGEFVETRAAAMILGSSDAAIMARARSLIDWHQRHGFCAKCGSKTRLTRGGSQRICEAEHCRAQHFPRVDPVVIMLVHDKNRCLLGRQSRFPEGMYSALAGFIEPGESLEGAVVRESFEEAGIRIGQVDYIASQPWPFPSSLMIGCMAKAETFNITMDDLELEDARWFTREEVRRAIERDPVSAFFLPPSIAIAHHLILHWLKITTDQ